MKYLQTYSSKVKELKRIKKQEKKLENELSEGSKEMIHLIVSILDEIQDNNIRINVQIEEDVRFFKISKINATKNINLHLGGTDTLIYWKSNDMLHKETLWNFISGGNSNFEEIAAILDYLIEKYNKEYNLAIAKKTAINYNL